MGMGWELLHVNGTEWVHTFNTNIQTAYILHHSSKVVNKVLLIYFSIISYRNPTGVFRTFPGQNFFFFQTFQGILFIFM